ncbi:hypothetical protein BDK51DRAFT_27454 [Blyttiomyces helicus]|uniref:Uncharacterized protein n=1 Tax=Blyttiomyces helicus TaxID=388810 RepID=A0A4P9WR06_9FUNG|nr:hypothetical protein BDK51DRAFT_27454 [Blyttiomyces helicus]|eukprot:RKO94643.1 hypothetical protein BDK51DRAFT_27454 [Blyttiomyces helicus]
MLEATLSPEAWCIAYGHKQQEVNLHSQCLGLFHGAELPFSAHLGVIHKGNLSALNCAYLEAHILTSAYLKLHTQEYMGSLANACLMGLVDVWWKARLSPLEMVSGRQHFLRVRLASTLHEELQSVGVLLAFLAHVLEFNDALDDTQRLELVGDMWQEVQDNCFAVKGVFGGVEQFHNRKAWADSQTVQGVSAAELCLIRWRSTLALEEDDIQPPDQEFVKKKTYAEEEGDSYSTRSTHTPFKNGVADQKELSVTEIAHFMLKHTSLNNHQWADIVSTAVLLYYQSLAPSPGDSTETLEECITGKSASVANLLKEKYKKRENGGKKRVLVSSSDTMKGKYQFWDVSNKEETFHRESIPQNHTSRSIDGEVLLDFPGKKPSSQKPLVLGSNRYALICDKKYEKRDNGRDVCLWDMIPVKKKTRRSGCTGNAHKRVPPEEAVTRTCRGTMVTTFAKWVTAHPWLQGHIFKHTSQKADLEALHGWQYAKAVGLGPQLLGKQGSPTSSALEWLVHVSLFSESLLLYLQYQQVVVLLLEHPDSRLCVHWASQTLTLSKVLCSVLQIPTQSDIPQKAYVMSRD